MKMHVPYLNNWILTINEWNNITPYDSGLLIWDSQIPEQTLISPGSVFLWVLGKSCFLHLYNEMCNRWLAWPRAAIMQIYVNIHKSCLSDHRSIISKNHLKWFLTYLVMSVCVCVCLHVWTCTHVHMFLCGDTYVYMCICIWNDWTSFTLNLETRSFIGLEFNK